jgi:hypothetical protein
MTKNQSTAMVLFEALPAQTRRKLNLREIKSITGMVLIKDRVQSHFHEIAMREATLRKFKRAHGYCGGRPFCLAFTGEDNLCPVCLTEQRNLAAGVTRYKRNPSAYGTIRAKERKEAKAERDRLNGKR